VQTNQSRHDGAMQRSKVAIFVAEACSHHPVRFAIAAVCALMGGACSFGIELPPFFDGPSTSQALDAGYGLESSEASRFDAAQNATDGDVGSNDAATVPDQAIADAAETGTSPKCKLPNLLKNGDMESGLAPWFADYGNAESKMTAAHTGQFGLRLCSQGIASYYGTQTLTPALSLARYHVRIWVRAAVASGPLAVGMAVANEVSDGPQMNIGPATDKWKCSELESSQIVTGVVANVSAAGATCVDLDDAELVEMPVGVPLAPECRCP
jgi:hypothetical protein